MEIVNLVDEWFVKQNTPRKDFISQEQKNLAKQRAPICDSCEYKQVKEFETYLDPIVCSSCGNGCEIGDMIFSLKSRCPQNKW
jgi:hypothetical protein